MPQILGIRFESGEFYSYEVPNRVMSLEVKFFGSSRICVNIHSFQWVNTENCAPQSIQITLIRKDPIFLDLGSSRYVGCTFVKIVGCVSNNHRSC